MTRVKLVIRKVVLVLLVAGLLPTTNPQGASANAANPPPINPFTLYLPVISNNASPQSDTLVQNQYIIALHADESLVVNGANIDGGQVQTGVTVADMASQYASAYGGAVLYTYEDALKGFTLTLPPETVNEALAALKRDPLVAAIEQNAIVTINDDWAQTSDDSLLQISANQVNPPSWGLDRIDQINLPLNKNYTYHTTGAGVKVYVIDTGILTTHADFGGRAASGYDAVDGALPADDCNGHGTHVAGTIGGNSYGVAKGVQLIAVRVLDCSGYGTFAGVIAGVDWVTTQKRNNPATPMTANMSLGGGASQILDNAVANSIAAGVTYVVAAGNSNANACNYSPARTPAAITVGATTASDSRSSFSNWGSCLDIFAPGEKIVSAWYTSNTASRILSGTSMAAPHVSGAAALYLATHSNGSPSSVTSALLNMATVNVVGNAGSGSPNRLLNTLPVFQVDANPQAIVLGYVNGDSFLDVVTANQGANDVSVLLGRSDGTFNVASGYATDANPTSVALGYVNGDSFLDIVTANQGANDVSVLLGRGDGTFNVASGYATHATPKAVALGYINGDSFLDIVTANYGANNVSVLLGRGDGTFNVASGYATHANPTGVALGYVNGDAYLDIVTANYGANNVSILLGRGDGTFNVASGAATDANPRSVALGYVNADAYLDIVTTNYGANGVSVLLGRGDGTFNIAYSAAAHANPQSVALGYVNGDAFLDIVTANYGANNISVLLGRGDGSFNVASGYATHLAPTAVALGDIDRNGTLDAATANSGVNDVFILWGKGNGTY